MRACTWTKARSDAHPAPTTRTELVIMLRSLIMLSVRSTHRFCKLCALHHLTLMKTTVSEPRL